MKPTRRRSRHLVGARALGLAAAASAALLVGATAASAAPNVPLGFAIPAPGTVLDKDGQGTGFTGVMANTAGNQHVPANLDVGGGLLRVTTTPGDAVGGTNTQQNALQTSFTNPSDEDYRVMATLRGPLNLTQQFQGGGIFIGPDQQNYVKLIAGVGAGGPRIQFGKEVNGSFAQVGNVNLAGVNTAARIDLVLEVDVEAGTVSAKYSINNGPLQNVGGSTAFAPAAEANGTAGVITTSGGGPAATIAYDAFLVEPVSILAFNSPVPIHNFSAVEADTPNSGPQNGLQFPTSIAIGPDGRLYASAQYGRIHVLNLNGNNDVTGVQAVINEIFNTPNQTFNGQPKSQKGRQITGIAFDPSSTAANPVLYVSHSDPEIFEEADPGQSTVYPASGRVTKLTLNSAGAVVAQQNIVVGLPRSGENHSPNGLAFGPDGWLYLALGGNTNAGDQSKPFGFFPETPLSASVVRINPGNIGGGTINVTSNSTFGFNQSGQVTGLATSVPNFPGQFEMHATGFRNPYDLLWHTNGGLYTAENERNEGFGNGPGANTAPAGACPSPAVPADTPNDRLFLVQQGGYHGHPNPSRGECALRNTNGTVPGGGVAPIGDFQKNSSTTGLTEYTADTTGPLLKGQILATSYANVSGGNKLQRVKLNAAGTQVLEKADVATNMSAPIDVAVAPNGDILVAEHNRFAVGGPGAPSGRISRIRPVPTSGLGCSPLGPQADSDGDGYSDMDEIDNGTSRCNPADRPPDFDGDGISDLNDPDADGDGVIDTQDQWQRDPANGTNTPLPFNLPFNTPQGGGWFGTGFGGIQLSSNGGGPLAGRISAGGAGGFLSVTATGGTADGAANNQHNALQQGFDARNPFTSSISVVEPYSVTGPQGNSGTSLFFGPGENDFVRVGVSANGGNPIIELHREVGGAPARTAAVPLGLPVSAVRLFLEGRPASNQVVAYYKVGSGAVTQLGAVDVPAGWFTLPGSTGVMTTGAGAPDPNIAFILDEFRIDAGDISSVPGVGGVGTTAACATVPKRATTSGRGRIRLTPGQLFINQRISQAAVRRSNAVQARLDRRIRTADICGHALGTNLFGATVSLASGGQIQSAEPAKPAAINTGRRKAGGGPARVTLTARQLRINQRISQAAVRRSNALKARLDAGLTGGDVADGAITAGKLAPGFAVASAQVTGRQPARTVTRVKKASNRKPGRVTLTARQLRINQRISQAAVRRSNALIDRLETGLDGGDFKPGSLTAFDLAPNLRG